MPKKKTGQRKKAEKQKARQKEIRMKGMDELIQSIYRLGHVTTWLKYSTLENLLCHVKML